MDLELAGRTALVTGGSRGIGKAIARELAGEGVDVAIVGRDEEALRASADEIAGETGRRIVPIRADTGRDEDVRRMVEEARAALGRIDILVTAAGAPGGHTPPPKLAEIDDDVFWNDVNVKVMGYLRCAREVAPLMVEQGWGRIVMISGLGARRTGSIVGSIRNIGVVALAKNLADSLGRHRITVNVVHPGNTITEKSAGVFAKIAEREGASPEAVAERIAAQTTTRRIVEAREIGYLVAFLCSPKATAITGEVIAAGGGSPGPIAY
jgi:NAD(P)-dependent dehydrogenase (short-subunit alcohol dehydrogenase family)